ncbi:hypothetical protein FUAX_29310 [Fulvitalea axinellae]|uniref:Peptide-N(4)-(N-acetyl-beta-glucosaminyl)asparagine amidase n=2 Tax=Fulvitalea axinellae TaxID=1182444 RepID=A0AAU9CEB8_9BACT|nr:hypothetical protein FUAX_29310 [Fulvitalea axinellae]
MVLVAYACSTPESRIVELAGANGKELKATLALYEGDAVKFRAMNFLIRSLPYHYSIDSLPYFSRWKAYAEMRDIMRSERRFSWRKGRDVLDSLLSINGKSQEYKAVQEDLFEVSSEYLKGNTDLAFESRNGVSKLFTCTEEQFFEYVLPYRVRDRMLKDSWRTFYRKKNDSLRYKLLGESVPEAIKGFMGKTRRMGFNPVLRGVLDYWDYTSYEMSNAVNCDQATVYNLMILRSQGIPCAIDFVPSWANVNSWLEGGHSWNTIVTKDKSYPFDPFYSEDMFNLKELYNNKYWNRRFTFKLPKVYRETYSVRNDNVLKHKKVKLGNIPSAFRKYGYKDVSEEYFEASTLEFDVQGKLPSDTYYLYLCVYQKGGWRPVTLAEIEDDKVVFPKMGRGILYQLAYCKSSVIFPVGKPLFLNEQGKIRYFNLSGKGRERRIQVKRQHLGGPHEDKDLKYLAKTEIQISNDSLWRDYKVLAHVPDSMLNARYNQRCELVKKKYVRLTFRGDSLRLGELSLYRSGERIDLKACKVKSNCQSSNQDLRKVSDGEAYSEVCLGRATKDSVGYVVWELPKGVSFDSLRVDACVKTDLKNGLVYELVYLGAEHQWISLGGKKYEGDLLVYENVPEDEVLTLRWVDEKGRTQYGWIFEYRNGRQEWF